ncbi:hypothetical protein GCK72_023883 [Caenorhabditis remanei]|uniref:Uncharacterized protein n=1 Tax=Caenorhabditis remanei TaxID=31234 RepID=A0A6A5FYC8_CAERE|nr:hypothetical protein GCK72_023883 [Caenorhabditis remanei]KAF1747421.1 hypothetical protein GCK72_023883 [Caenorhabditis remanei]
MKVLLLLFCVLSLVESISRIRTTVVNAQITLRCKAPKSPDATVFLMERDFDDSAIDEDDTMDFSTYTFGKSPEMKLTLEGEQFEFSGLDPYIYVTHNCAKSPDSWKTYTVDLMSSMYYSRTFDIIIDLDTETSIINYKRIQT